MIPTIKIAAHPSPSWGTRVSSCGPSREIANVCMSNLTTAGNEEAVDFTDSQADPQKAPAAVFLESESRSVRHLALGCATR